MRQCWDGSKSHRGYAIVNLEKSKGFSRSLILRGAGKDGCVGMEAPGKAGAFGGRCKYQMVV
jgi:hypothetical protein